jgi:hypothetical protein
MTRDPTARLLPRDPHEVRAFLFVCVPFRLDVAKQFRDAL